MDADIIRTILVYAIPVVFAITLHEVAHGWVARYFGDPTAAMQGRLTLNPIAHIDLVGTVIMPIALLVLTEGKFVFGYAKPVPVNYANLRNPKNNMIWVALAGPMTNFIQAIFWAIVLTILFAVDVKESFFLSMAFAGIMVNLVLWALNLFPLPPLDGGRILVGLLPYEAARKVASVERYGFIILLVLLFTNILSHFWLSPLVELASKTFAWFFPILNALFA